MGLIQFDSIQMKSKDEQENENPFLKAMGVSEASGRAHPMATGADGQVSDATVRAMALGDRPLADVAGAHAARCTPSKPNKAVETRRTRSSTEGSGADGGLWVGACWQAIACHGHLAGDSENPRAGRWCHSKPTPASGGPTKSEWAALTRS